MSFDCLADLSKQLHIISSNILQFFLKIGGFEKTNFVGWLVLPI